MKSFSLLSIFCLLALACGGGDSCSGDGLLGTSTCAPDGPEEYLSNPSIGDAITESRIPIHTGDAPPPLIGDYQVDGEVARAATHLQELVGASIQSRITLYDQTASGRISVREAAQGFVVDASGGYITGEEGAFTIYGLSSQSHSEDGWTASVDVAFIMSGTKTQNGDLIAEGLSVVTRAQSTHPEADLDDVVGSWWKWVADLELIGPPSPELVSGVVPRSGFPWSVVLGVLVGDVTRSRVGWPTTP